MTAERNPHKSALIDINKIANSLDAEVTDYLLARSDLTQRELLDIVRNGLGQILTRIGGVTLVEVLRDAQKAKDTHEAI